MIQARPNDHQLPYSSFIALSFCCLSHLLLCPCLWGTPPPTSNLLCLMRCGMINQMASTISIGVKIGIWKLCLVPFKTTCWDDHHKRDCCRQRAWHSAAEGSALSTAEHGVCRCSENRCLPAFYSWEFWWPLFEKSLLSRVKGFVVLNIPFYSWLLHYFDLMTLL